jgi:RimJ/RimL family protein N-acetyltransferase
MSPKEQLGIEMGQQPLLPEDAQELARPMRLIDEQIVRVRPIMWDDDDRLRAFHARLSADTIVYRFFSLVPALMPEPAHHFTHVDYENRMALVATIGTHGDEQIIGVVRYDRLSPDSAEVAFVVEDHWQGHGIATELLHRLAPYARARGIVTFVAVTMMGNNRMLEVLRNAGYPLTYHVNGTEVEVRLGI